MSWQHAQRCRASPCRNSCTLSYAVWLLDRRLTSGCNKCVGAKRLHRAEYPPRKSSKTGTLIDVECRVRAVESNRRGFALAFVVDEIVRAILPQRPAVSAVEALVRVREHALLNEVGSVEARVAEAGGKTAGVRVGARPGDRVHQHAVGSPLRRIPPAGDELEFADRLRRWRFIVPPAMLFYCLVVRGGILDGPAGFYYAFQRAMAELMLSHRLNG